MIRFLLISLTFYCYCDAAAAAAAASVVTDGETHTVPSRVVLVEKIGDPENCHYVLGSVHDQPIESYIPNEDLRAKLFGCSKVFSERESLTQAKLKEFIKGGGVLAELTREFPSIAAAEERHWVDIFYEDAEKVKTTLSFFDKDKPIVGYTVTDLQKAFETFIIFFKSKESVLRGLPECWGIAYISLLSKGGRFLTVDEEEKPSSELDGGIVDIFRKNGKQTGELETVKDLIEHSFKASNNFTKDEGFDEILMYTLLMAKAMGLTKITEAASPVETTTVFSANHSGSKEGNIFQGISNRDKVIAESILRHVKEDTASGLFIAGANHLPGVLDHLTPWFEKNGYNISFVRQKEEAPGYEFIEASLEDGVYSYG